MNRHDQIHDRSTSTMYFRGRLRRSSVPHMSLKFYALREDGEAVAFMWFGDNHLSPIPEAWGIVYPKGNQ